MSVSPEVTEARRRWVEALESGRWRRTQQALRDDGRGRCCLGVACSVSGLGRWRGRFYWVRGEADDQVLPRPVAAALGVPTGELLTDLTGRNDGWWGPPGDLDGTHRPWTFAEIAALLRSDDWFGPDLDRVLT